jgi:putative phosphoribosyl transferase
VKDPWHPESGRFRDRREGGQALAEALAGYRGAQGVVLGIARGGVAVGREIAVALGMPLEVTVPRKLPIPCEPEAGFGAVMPDGTRVLNHAIVERLGLSRREIDEVAERVLAEVRRRAQRYQGDRSPLDLQGRVAIVADDGLATGYTMIAALRSARERGPKGLVTALPVSPTESLLRVQPECDRAFCLITTDLMPFAVAQYYDSFPDMSDEEVIQLLEDPARPTAAERS